MSQPTLFGDAPNVAHCHDCGGELSELDRVIPKTCLVRLDCCGCCTSCHHAALSRIVTAPSYEEFRALWDASYRGFREGRRR